MKPDEQLPTIKELTTLWDISYATATKTITALRDDLYVRTTSTGTYVYLARHERLYRQLCDVLNALEDLQQDPHVSSRDGVPDIYGKNGRVRWNPEAERWVQLTA